MQRFGLLGTYAGVLLFGCLAVSPSSKADEVLRIGLVGPMTGSYAAIGDQMWRGANKAAEDINASGGIDGKKIVLIKQDDACEPKQAVALAHRLVNDDHVVAVVGHACSSCTIPASAIYAQTGILQITGNSTNPQVTERGIETMFRMIGRDDQQGMVAADFIVNKLKAKRVAVLHDKDTYGKGLADAMRERMRTLGVEEVLYEGITRGDKDFNALVTKIKEKKSDVVYFGGLYAEAGLLVRQLRDQGSTTPFISGDGINTQDFVTSAGGPQYAEGVYMTFGRDPRAVPEGQKVVAEFKAQGFDPEGFTLYNYAAVQAVAAAISGAKSTEGEALGKWLHGQTVGTVMGPKSWDAKGDLKVSDYVIYSWTADGKATELQ